MAWYECKVSYPRDFGNGLEKRVTETYLVDAVSYTEAEARITEVLLRWETESQGRQERVLSAEAGGNWLQRSWRPVLMLAFAAIILVGAFVELPILADSSRFWDLLEIGIGGYIIGKFRSY